MNRNPCIGWADGDVVSHVLNDGRVIAEGRVVVRRNQQGRPYLKVCLKTAGTGLGRYGEWVWPEGWVWGRGTLQAKCFECGQKFRTNDPDEAHAEFCPPCQRREFQARRQAGTAIRNHTGYLIAGREAKPRTEDPDERAIAAVKQADEKESPF